MNRALLAEIRHRIRVDEADLVRSDYFLTRQIGESAHEQRFQAIRSLSATGVDEILAVFPDNLGPPHSPCTWTCAGPR